MNWLNAYWRMFSSTDTTFSSSVLKDSGLRPLEAKRLATLRIDLHEQEKNKGVTWIGHATLATNYAFQSCLEGPASLTHHALMVLP